MKVVLEVPGVALLAEETLDVVIAINGQNSFTLTNGKCTGDGYVIEKLQNGYKLSLSGFNGTNITFMSGTWTIVLSGTNSIDNPGGEALILLPSFWRFQARQASCGRCGS